MSLKGIIITGTRGSGKTSVINELVKRNKRFKVIREITTRTQIEENDFICIDSMNFELCKKTYYSFYEDKGEKYAYPYSEIETAINNNIIPILVEKPALFNEMKKEEKEGKREGWKTLQGFLSFFIDSNDEQLKERIVGCDNKLYEEYVKYRKTERAFSDVPDYIIQNNNLICTVNMIERMVELYHIGTSLSEQDISLYINNGMLINGGSLNNVQGASYDLMLGDEYYYRGEIMRLDQQNLVLKISPYDYAIVSSKEEICLPKDVIAHFGLTVGLFCQGIILSNGQQVDPGFRGRLFCLLFNTSNQIVTIKKNSHYATIEFEKMNSFAREYKGKYQETRDIIDVLPANAMQGGLSELKQEIEELKHESRNMQALYISVISLIIAAISMMLIVR